MTSERDAQATDMWEADWEATRRRALTKGLDVTPAERVRWLEEMIVLAHRTGALPRPSE